MDTNDDDSDVINDDGQAKKLGLGLLLKLQWEWKTIFQASMAPNYSTPYNIVHQTIAHHNIFGTKLYGAKVYWTKL